MSTFLDIYLEEIAQVVKRWTRFAELSLLLNRRRFGIALSDDDATQCIAKLTWHFLVSGTTVVIAEPHFGIGLRRLKKDAPPVIRHLHVIEVRPPFGAYVDSSAKPD